MVEGMGRRKILNADAQDVHTNWRHYYCWTKRAGATSKTKRITRRWERARAKRRLRKEQW